MTTNLTAPHTERLAELAADAGQRENPEWWAQLAAAYAFTAGLTAALTEADLEPDDQEVVRDAYLLADQARRAADQVVIYERSVHRHRSPAPAPDTHTDNFFASLADQAIADVRAGSLTTVRCLALGAAQCAALIEDLEH